MTREQVTAYLQLVDYTTSGYCSLQEFWKPGRHRFRDMVIGGFEEYAFPSRWEQILLRNVDFSELFF